MPRRRHMRQPGRLERRKRPVDRGIAMRLQRRGSCHADMITWHLLRPLAASLPENVKKWMDHPPGKPRRPGPGRVQDAVDVDRREELTGRRALPDLVSTPTEERRYVVVVIRERIVDVRA